MKRLVSIAFAASLLALAPDLASAETVAPAERGGIEIDLNKLEPAEDACHLYLVFANATARALTSLKLDLVLFDPEGVIRKRLAVDGAPLPPGKTRLEVFEVAGLRCDSVGQVLLNDVLACEAEGARLDDCLGLIEPVARGPVPLIM